MLGQRQEIIILNKSELQKIIENINEEYNLTTEQTDYFNPTDVLDLFINENNIGTDCYVKLDVSRTAIDREASILAQCVLNNWPGIRIRRIRLRILEYIYKNIPANINIVMVYI